MNPLVILVVDDDAGLQYYLRRLLKVAGVTILTAGDGKAALAASRGYPGTIDLLLTDMDMPQMDGLTLCRRVAAERPGIKSLVMSGDPSGRERVSMSGLPFLEKPFTLTALRSSIEDLLGPIPPMP